MKKPRGKIVGTLWWVNPTGYSVIDGLSVCEQSIQVSTEMTGAVRFEETVNDAATIIPWVKETFSGSGVALVANNWEVPTFPTAWVDLDHGAPRYNMLKPVAIHREFAEVAPRHDSIVSFANKYGFLTSDLWVLEDRTGLKRIGESIHLWHSEIFTARTILTLQEIIDSSGGKYTDAVLEKLWEYVRFDEGCAYVVTDIPKQGFDVLPGVGWEVPFEPLPVGLSDIPNGVLATMAIISDVVNENLARFARPAIEIRPGGQVHVLPDCLLGAIYIHLAQELLGRSDPLIRCKSCGKWFVARHGGREYCTNACRQKAYRRSKEKQNGK